MEINDWSDEMYRYGVIRLTQYISGEGPQGTLIQTSSETDDEWLEVFTGPLDLVQEIYESLQGRAYLLKRIAQLESAGDQLAQKMKQASDTGWDEVLDHWEQVRYYE